MQVKDISALRVEEATTSAGRSVVLSVEVQPGHTTSGITWLDKREVEELRDHLTELLERW